MKQFAPGLLLAGALLLSACGQQPITAEEIVDRMEQARDATNDIHATVAINATTPEEQGNITIEGWAQRTGETTPDGHPIARVRAEVRSASKPEMLGAVAVSDGKTFWIYNPSENTVITGNAEDLPENPSPDPAGAATAMQDLIQQGLDAVDLEVLGEEAVAGKTAWKVKMTPKAETELPFEGVVSALMWVDTDLALPLKLDVDGSDLGSGSVEVQSLEHNPGLSPDLFTFTIPEGATVIDAAEIIAEHQKEAASSVEEAQAAVDFTLAAPSTLPVGFSLVEVRMLGKDTVVQNYANADQQISLVQSANAELGSDLRMPASAVREQITVHGQPAELITLSGERSGSMVRWAQNGVYLIATGNVSAEMIVAFAETVE